MIDERLTTLDRRGRNGSVHSDTIYTNDCHSLRISQLQIFSDVSRRLNLSSILVCIRANHKPKPVIHDYPFFRILIFLCVLSDAAWDTVDCSSAMNKHQWCASCSLTTTFFECHRSVVIELLIRRQSTIGALRKPENTFGVEPKTSLTPSPSRERVG